MFASSLQAWVLVALAAVLGRKHLAQAFFSIQSAVIMIPLYLVVFAVAIVMTVAYASCIALGNWAYWAYLVIFYLDRFVLCPRRQQLV